METLASSFSFAFGYSDQAPVQLSSARPYRDEPSENQQPEEDNHHNLDKDKQDTDSDFGDFVDAPPLPFQTSQDEHDHDFGDGASDDESFGAFASANNNTSTSLLPIYHHQSTINPENLPTTFGTFASANPITNETPQTATSTSNTFPGFGTFHVPFTVDTTKGSSLSLDESQSQPGQPAQPMHRTTLSSNPPYDTFPVTPTAESEIATSDEQFDFARPPESSTGNLESLDLDSPPTTADTMSVTSSSEPTLETTQATVVSRDPTIIPHKTTMLLPKLPPPKSQSVSSNIAKIKKEVVDLLGDFSQTAESSTCPLQDDFATFAAPVDSKKEETVDGNHDLAAFAAPVNTNGVQDTTCHAKDTNKSPNGNVSEVFPVLEPVCSESAPETPTKVPNTPKHNTEEEEWGDFAGFHDKMIETALVDKPEGREAKNFEVTGASPNRFSFYNPSGLNLTKSSPLPSVSSACCSSSLPSQTTFHPKVSDAPPITSVKTVTTSITDAFAALTTHNHSPEIETLRHQLMEQKKNESQRIHALQAQHSKALLHARSEAHQEMQKQHAEELERLRSASEEAEAALICARSAAQAEDTLAALKAKHAKELAHRDEQVQRMRSEVEASVRKDMQAKHEESMAQTSQQWERRLAEAREQAVDLARQVPLEQKDKPEARKKVLAHQAEILSLKRKLEKVQEEASGKTIQMSQALAEKETEWTQKERDLRAEMSLLESELTSLRESSLSKESAFELSMKEEAEKAAVWECKYKALLKETNSEKLRLQAQIDGSRASVQTLRMNEARMIRQVEHLEKQLQASAESLAAACGSENAMEEALQQQRDSNNEMYNRMEAQLTSERDALKAEVEARDSALAQKEEALQALQASMAEEKKKTDVLCHNEIKLQQATKKLQKMITEFQREVQLRDKLIERLRNDLLGRDGELATLEKELEEAQERIQKSLPEKDAVNLNYLKDVVVKYLCHPPGSSERAQLLPVLATVLKFDAKDYEIIEAGKQKLSWWGSVTPTLISAPFESLAGSTEATVLEKDDSSSI